MKPLKIYIYTRAVTAPLSRRYDLLAGRTLTNGRSLSLFSLSLLNKIYSAAAEALRVCGNTQKGYAADQNNNF